MVLVSFIDFDASDEGVVKLGSVELDMLNELVHVPLIIATV
jgi:hypothetical protein